MDDRADSPYLGLVPYSERDARFFFGRERDQRRVMASLFASRLTLLYGASGVGKSSLLRAGLIAEVRRRNDALRQQAEPVDAGIIYFNAWQGDLLAGFRQSVRDSMSGLLPAAAIDEVISHPTLSGVLDATVAALDGDLFVVFDQFEEFFLYHGQSDSMPEFAREFTLLTGRQGSPISFLLSLRDDALSKLDYFKGHIPGLFSNYLRISHLSIADAREAIVRPLEAYSDLPADQRAWPGKFSADEDLIKGVLAGVQTGQVAVGDTGRGRARAGEGVETPYLQLVLMELWRQECENESTTLRLATLHELGGATAIVRNHLDRTLSSFSESERETCARLFQYLVTPSGTKVAHTVDDLAQFAQRSLADALSVVERLCGSGMRILSPVAPPMDRPGPIRYEIYHDALAQAILAWRRRYLSAQQAAEVEREHQLEAARQQEELNRVTAFAEAQRQKAEVEKLRAVEQKTAATKYWRLAIVAAAFALFSIGLAGVAYYYNRQAESARLRAEISEAAAKKSEADFASLSKQLNDALQAASSELAKAMINKVDKAEASRISAMAESYKSRLDTLEQNRGTDSEPAARNPNPQLEAELAAAQKKVGALEDTQKNLVSRQQLIDAQEAAKKSKEELDDRIKALTEQLQNVGKPVSPGPAPDAGRPRTPSDEDPAIRRTIGEYAAVQRCGLPDSPKCNTVNLASLAPLKALYPSYYNEQGQRLANNLRTLEQYQLEIKITQVNIFPDLTTAVVDASVERTLGSRAIGGKPKVIPDVHKYYLLKQSGLWVIVGQL